MEHLFKHVDANKDGKVSKGEIVKHLNDDIKSPAVKKIGAENVAKHILGHCDENDDGMIEEKEAKCCL